MGIYILVVLYQPSVCNLLMSRVGEQCWHILRRRPMTRTAQLPTAISRTATSLELEDSGRRAIRAEYVEVRAARLGTRLCTSMSPVGELVR
jgi:hypothetical protein